MPRHLISDAHEWMNEIPTVPIYYLANPQPRERAWKNQRGKKVRYNNSKVFPIVQNKPKLTTNHFIFSLCYSIPLSIYRPC